MGSDTDKLGVQQKDECFILVKALPHRSSTYFETVCCAGVGRDGLWRRQYPVPFRILDGEKQFGRWSWIRYKYVKSPDDPRSESQKVVPESIEIIGAIKASERARILNPLIRRSLKDADRRGESLALIRPKSLRFSWVKKSADEVDDERKKHKILADQLSLFDDTAKPLEPCDYRFKIDWIDQEGARRSHTCDDWETVSAFRRRRFKMGESDALDSLRVTYEKDYLEAGMALAFSTHSRRNIHFSDRNQWLLVGIVRLDENTQSDLFL